MENRPSSFDSKEFAALDIKALISKILSYWKWFVVSLVVAYFLTKYINGYQQPIYSMSSLITVKEEKNPIFSSSTNIAFNWGGPSDKVETIKTILQSRTHNEKVVQEMQYYIDYLQEGKHRMQDIYGRVPFKVIVDTTKYQLSNTLLKLEFLSEDRVKLSIDYANNPNRSLLNYHNSKRQVFTAPNNTYSQEFPIGKIQTDFLSITLDVFRKPQLGKEYFIRFKSFNGTVGHYKNIRVATAKKGTSLMTLSLVGPNKNRLVDYINTTVEILAKDAIEAKIKYAVKTKQYIDTVFEDESNNLKKIEKDLGDFKKQQNIYNLSTEGSAIFSELLQLDSKKRHYQDRLVYFQTLKTYINSHDSFDENTVPVPAVLEMEDGKISQSIGDLVSKSKMRETLLQSVTSDYPPLKQLNADIELERNSLLENLSMLYIETNKNLKRDENRLNSLQFKLNKLPEKEQKLLSYERRYAITEQTYNYLKQKSWEAGTAIASNVSDIKVIDNAKDIGGGYLSPNKSRNTMIGFALAIILPLVLIVISAFFNNKIQTVEEVETKFRIPILGVLGSHNEKSNLIVFNKPKSALSEAYRALRSNVQFMLKRNADSHILLFTSSISSEGKTITAINLASVLALSGKKTILVGVDLRKPKIAEEFGLSKKVGLVHYLINKKKPEEIIQKTEYENLDILLSGPVPPNPAELLMSEATSNMLDYLRTKYEYILLDAPPIGAVSDAQELFKYADAILYLVRQGRTDIGALKMIETKYKRGDVKNISYILNDFAFSKRHSFGYGYGGYGYGYGGGYGYGYGYNNQEKESFFKRIFNRKTWRFNSKA